MDALLGKKIGMTQVFSDSGDIINVTAIEAGPCTVLAIKDKSLQIGFDRVSNEKRVKKPLLGYFKKANVAALKFIREVKRPPGKEYKTGDVLKVDLFKSGDFVDVTSTSKGKGFQGGMKRWNWKGGPMTHGSMSHRRVGSIGSSATPSRVYKGRHMPGHMGNIKVTVQNIKVVKILPENNIILINGAVPGYKNSYLVIRKALKKKAKV